MLWEDFTPKKEFSLGVTFFSINLGVVTAD
jgi:hypothetical protein